MCYLCYMQVVCSSNSNAFHQALCDQYSSTKLILVRKAFFQVCETVNQPLLPLSLANPLLKNGEKAVEAAQILCIIPCNSWLLLDIFQLGSSI